MSFTVIDAPQRSPEWKRARAGRVTGSVAADMLAKPTTAAYRNLLMRLVAEQLTGEPEEDTFVNEAMQWGIAHEDEARIAYEWQSGVTVQETGFLQHDDCMAGVSLDGHIGDFAGLVEIKCPYRTARHVAVLRGGVPSEYAAQIRHALWVTGAQWCDFVSYDPRMPERLRVVVHRVTRDADEMTDYGDALAGFLRAVAWEVDSLQTLADVSARLRAAVAS